MADDLDFIGKRLGVPSERLADNYSPEAIALLGALLNEALLAQLEPKAAGTTPEARPVFLCDPFSDGLAFALPRPYKLYYDPFSDAPAVPERSDG